MLLDFRIFSLCNKIHNDRVTLLKKWNHVKENIGLHSGNVNDRLWPAGRGDVRRTPACLLDGDDQRYHPLTKKCFESSLEIWVFCVTLFRATYAIRKESDLASAFV
jgi:hypothetical protein